MKTKPWMMLVTMMAGWINRQQQDALDYLRQLIINMAKDNKHLGGKTLHGYLKYLGIKVSPSTINRVLREHGVDQNKSAFQ